MNVTFVSQYAGEEAHYKDINNQLLSSNKYKSFRLLSAFVTLGGLVMIEEALSKFISEGNSIDWIIGIDQGITSREALEFLKGLQIKYPDNVNIRILTAGSNSYIFHPKAYCFENDEDCVIINRISQQHRRWVIR